MEKKKKKKTLPVALTSGLQGLRLPRPHGSLPLHPLQMPFGFKLGTFHKPWLGWKYRPAKAGAGKFRK